MAALITAEQAKAELRIVTDDENEYVEELADRATTTILYYLYAQADPAWTIDTVPGAVQQAIRVLLVNLYNRDPTADEATWAAIDRLIVGFRDPALA